MARRRVRWSWRVGAALFGLVLLGAGIAIADVPDGNTINGCRSTTSFVLRVIDKSAGQTCAAGETAISWTSWRWRGTYGATTSYNTADVVFYGGSSYLVVAKPPSAGVPPTNLTYWRLIASKGAPGINWRGPWSNAVSYAIGDGVSYSGTSYRAKATPPVGALPTNPTYWEVIAAEGNTAGWELDLRPTGAPGQIQPDVADMAPCTTDLSATASECNPVLADGVVVTLTATASIPGQRFAHWTGDCAGTTTTCVVTMTDTRTVGAVFTGLAPLTNPGPAPATITLPPGGASGIAFDGSSLWLTESQAWGIWKIDPATNAISQTIDLTNVAKPSTLFFDGTDMWAAASPGSGVELLKMTTAGAIEASYPLPSTCTPTALLTIPSNLFVSCGSSGELLKLKVTTGDLVSRFQLGSGTQGLAFDGSSIWIATSGSSGALVRLNPSTGETSTYTEFSCPQDVAFDGAHIWVSDYCAPSDQLFALDPDTGNIENHYPIPSPYFFAYNGTKLWIAAAHDLIRLNTTTGAIEQDYPSSNGWEFGHLTFDGSNIWALVADGSLRKVPA